ncbi:glycosyltransferase family 4 protein [Bacteroides bouchesdurhonensis]
MKLIFEVLLSKSDDIFIFYGESSFYHFFKIFSRKIKLYVERNEYPSYLILKEELSFKVKSKLVKFEESFRHVNGIITCSYALKEYYSKWLNEKEKIAIIPLLIDYSLFTEKLTFDYYSTFDYIAYCGYMGNDKDGVSTLIRSFTKILPVYPTLKLVLIGGAEHTEIKALLKIVEEESVTKNVIFTGRMEHSKVIPILRKAKLLALSRPSNKQAEGGIPSKVGEYLASGVPCVITNVGELHLFLRDGFNCYMTEPDSIESFADKILQALADPEREKIVKQAIITAYSLDCSIQAKELLKFLNLTE